MLYPSFPIVFTLTLSPPLFPPRYFSSLSPQLIQNGTVMGALTRVLQEEYKKSTELTFNILRSDAVRSVVVWCGVLRRDTDLFIIFFASL